MIAYRGPPKLTGPVSAGSADEIRRLERSVWSPVPPQTSSPAGPDPGPAPRDITRLLQSYVEGRDEALDELMPLVYEDLKQIARNHLRREPDGLTLRTTALLHESYLRMMGSAPASVRDRSHFFAIASRVMRNILVDHARARRSAKRGGDRVRVTLEPDADSETPRTLELLALDQALQRLGERDGRMERVVECRVFGGMTVRETAEVVGVAVRTVEKDWTMAKAFLHMELSSADVEE